MSSLNLLVVAVLVSWGYVLADDIPKCDPSIVAAFQKYYADPPGVPTDMASTLQENSPYSYMKLSESDIEERCKDVTCVGFYYKNNVVTITKKLAKGFPLTMTMTYKEKDGVMSYKAITDTKPKNQVYHFMNGCVALTYRCSDNGTGDQTSIGVAVADKLKDKPECKTALADVYKKLDDLNVSDDLKELKFCSES